jgi:hypothetical protein
VSDFNLASAMAPLAREMHAQMLVQLTRPMLLEQLAADREGRTIERGLTLEEAYAHIDQNSHGPKLREAIPPHLDISNQWWWLPEEYGDDDCDC